MWFFQRHFSKWGHQQWAYLILRVLAWKSLESPESLVCPYTVGVCSRYQANTVINLKGRLWLYVFSLWYDNSLFKLMIGQTFNQYCWYCVLLHGVMILFFLLMAMECYNQTRWHAADERTLITTIGHGGWLGLLTKKTLNMTLTCKKKDFRASWLPKQLFTSLLL